MAIIGNSIEEAALHLQHAVVAIPTETVYGLAGNALDANRVAEIFKVKNRPFFDPLIIHVSSFDRLNDLITDFPKPLNMLADAFWPGPLTLLLPRSQKVPDLTCSGLPDAAFRIPSHPLTLELLSKLDFPLAAPSANPFGYVSPTTANHVNDQLGDQIPYILDGGPCSVGLESTIVGMLNGKPTIFRLGGLSVEAIEAVIGQVSVQVNQSSDPRAPGMLKSHYAPGKPLNTGNLDALLDKFKRENPLLLVFHEFRSDYPVELQMRLSEDGTDISAASRLFDILRKADVHPAKRILAEFAPEFGLGKAINDRLKRASSSIDRDE